MRAVLAGVIAVCVLVPAGAFAIQNTDRKAPEAESRNAGAGAARADSGARGALPFINAPGQHGTLFGHLPPRAENLEVVGKLSPTDAQGEIVAEQIADLAVYKGYAYLNSWDEPSCTKGGTYIVDIRNPASPQEVGFIPVHTAGFYHGEGAHVVSIDTPEFTGDVLAVNNEACSNDATRPGDVPDTAGGFDLYDVTDPTDPKILIQDAGDRSPEFSEEQDPDQEFANSYHSVFMWQPPGSTSAYLVGVDNLEFADVDMYDISDPENPEFVKDLDLFEEFGETFWLDEIVSLGANGNNVFNHDMVVKQIGNRMVMIVSYWDGGYVQLDVTDPENPTYITDTDFDEPDPLTGFDPPEGNAHQSEFSHDNQFILAADEDFAPDRISLLEITDGPNVGEHPGSAIGGSASVALLDDGTLNGPTVYGGYGCTASTAVPERADYTLDLEPGEEAILVMQRGPSGDSDNPEAACFPGEKAANAVDAGWDAVVLTNHHDPDLDEDTPNCGSGGFSTLTVAVCGTHESLHQIFDEGDPDPDVPTGDAHNPTLGAEGARVLAEPQFDGWGYAHLYDANTSEELDAFAITEALDERFAVGFGDLSIHEFATDPTENLGYVSYYSGGIRVLRFSRAGGLQQVGAWIDQGGSNFWGVEQFTTPDGERLIAGSDRDYGLVILRYTGPGAAAAPSCEGRTVKGPKDAAVQVPLVCSDANGNTLTRRIVSQPTNGTLGPISGNTVTYTPNAGFEGTDTFTFAANDGAADSGVATNTVQIGGPEYETPTVPSNRFTTRIGRWRNGRLIVIVNVRAAGRLNVGLQANLPRRGRATAARFVRVARATRRPRAAGRVRVVLRPKGAKKRQLNRALRRSKRGRLRGRVKLSFTPTGGTTRRATRRITIR